MFNPLRYTHTLCRPPILFWRLPPQTNCLSSIIISNGNSEAARGLLVQQRVTSICTGIIISLVSFRRQLKRRDIIDAGHKLHAEEFRYLRTVRVTAAFN